MRYSAMLAVVLVPAAVQAQGARLERSDSGARVVAAVSRAARLTPDRATVLIFVEGQSETPTEASQRAGQKAEAALRALRQAGVQPEMSALVPYGATAAPVVTGFPAPPAQTSYVARHIIRVQFTNLDLVMPAVTAALAAGATAASAPTFESQAVDEARQRLYGEALAVARRDAGALAAALGGRLGSLIEVSSSAGPTPASTPGTVGFGARYEFSGPVQAPEVLATVTVTVRYQFLDR